MKFSVKLEKPTDFYDLVFALMECPINGDVYSEVSDSLFASNEEVFEFFECDGDIVDLYADIDNKSYDNIKTVNFGLKPLEYPCIAVCNFTESFDRASNVVVAMCDFIPLTGSHMIKDFYAIRDTKNDPIYDKACRIIDDRINAPDMSFVEAVDYYTETNKKLKKLIIGV